MLELMLNYFPHYLLGFFSYFPWILLANFIEFCGTNSAALCLILFKKFIELLRRGTIEDRDSAINCLRTALAPCALDAYPVLVFLKLYFFALSILLGIRAIFFMKQCLWYFVFVLDPFNIVQIGRLGFSLTVCNCFLNFKCSFYNLCGDLNLLIKK